MTDMNDIDIEEGRRLGDELRRLLTTQPGPWIKLRKVTAADIIDAIETGRQWETIARRLAMDVEAYWPGVLPRPVRAAIDSLVAFRDRADRTPGPTDGAS